jgi:hypothetical protein
MDYPPDPLRLTLLSGIVGPYRGVYSILCYGTPERKSLVNKQRLLNELANLHSARLDLTIAYHRNLEALDDRIHSAQKAIDLCTHQPLEDLSPVERKIIQDVIDHILALDHNVTVYNGGDNPELIRSTDRDTILGAIGATGSDCLYIESTSGVLMAVLYFVWGNDGDCLSDSCSRPLSSTISRMVERIADVDELLHK